MHVIWKYELNAGLTTIDFKHPATYLSAEAQGESVFIWFLLDLHPARSVPSCRTFSVQATGHQFDANDLKYLDTVSMLDGALIWHIFERKS